MNSNKPLVSIVIPVYNGSDYLKESIDSALAQDWPNTEVIVVNDGSTDKTTDIAKEYGESIRYFEKENGGQSTALNFGIEKMNGAFFSWLSHDDLYFPSKVSKQMEIALKYPDSVIYSDWMTISAEGHEISRTRIYNTDPRRFRFNLMTENRFHGCSMLVPKSLFVRYGKFDTSIPLTSDVDLWFRLSENADFLHLPEILVKGRIHGKQVSVKKYRQHQKESDLFYANCFNSFTNEEIMRHADDSNLKHLLYHLGRSFAKREYWMAVRAVNQRISREYGYIIAVVERLICGFHFQKKRLSNRLKYGILSRT